jgi:hypothetical protein
MLTQINHFKLVANFQSASVAYRIETRDSVLANETVGKTTAEAIVRRVAKQEPFAQVTLRLQGSVSLASLSEHMAWHRSSKALHFWPFHPSNWRSSTRHCDMRGFISHTWA